MNIQNFDLGQAKEPLPAPPAPAPSFPWKEAANIEKCS